MTSPIQISALCGDSAAEPGSPAQGLSNHSALYSPTVGPTLRKLTDAKYARERRYFPPVPRPRIEPKPVVEVVVAVEPPTKPKLSANDKRILIQRIVAEDFGMPVAILRGRKRKWAICAMRSISFYLILDLIALGYSESARMVGRTHAVLWRAEVRVRKLMLDDPEYAARVWRLRTEILSRFEAIEAAQ